ncbi:hypothetical protein EJ08DRAFT_146347 [Tothia fuscella]|uniref:Uncharacterized protein n=1 Tax=Tothia fuscella TaxID=1048955 RepID=A0A9P4P3W3_9PEZI|nr:hypothetical protein EJ08DRAFT_146347 [Tothia fuscella]
MVVFCYCAFGTNWRLPSLQKFSNSVVTWNTFYIHPKAIITRMIEYQTVTLAGRHSRLDWSLPRTGHSAATGSCKPILDWTSGLQLDLNLSSSQPRIIFLPSAKSNTAKKWLLTLSTVAWRTILAFGQALRLDPGQCTLATGKSKRASEPQGPGTRACRYAPLNAVVPHTTRLASH